MWKREGQVVLRHAYHQRSKEKKEQETPYTLSSQPTHLNVQKLGQGKEVSQ